MGNCPNCGTTARPQARFCSKCGTPLGTGAGFTPPPPPIPSFEKQSILSSAPMQSSSSSEEAQADPLALTQVEKPTSDAGGKVTVVEATIAQVELPVQVNALSSDAGTLSAIQDHMVEKEANVGATSTGASPFLVAETPDASVLSEHQQESVPLAPGKAEVIAQRAAIAAKLLGLVPFAKAEHRDSNRELFEKLAQQPLPIEASSWGQIAFIAGMYAPQMGGSRLQTRQKLELWQALLWAVQYEYYFRSTQFVDRFFRLAEFLSTSTSDSVFQTTAFNSLETILSQFDKPSLKNARNAVERLPVSSTVSALKQVLERYIALNDATALLAALERMWHRLDRNREVQNRATVADIRRRGLTSQLTARLVVMAVFVCRNLLEKTSPDATNDPSDEELQAALLLSTFARRFATGSYIAEAQKCDTLLKELCGRRARRNQEAGKVQPAPPEPPQREGKNGVHGKQEEQSVESSASDGAKKGQIAREKPALKDLQGALQEDPRRGLEAILGEEALSGLLESMRNFRLDAMRTILRRNRPRLLSAFSEMLAVLPFFDELLPPSSAFYVRGNVQSESFPDLKKRLLGASEEIRKRTLTQLEQMERDALERDKLLAHEWVLFARAIVLGLDKALPEWREHYSKGTASADEVWNLAVVAVRSGDKAQALEILKPGVKEQSAPLSHLCLALKCGVDILLQADHYARSATSMVTAFLLDYLTSLPLPEAYLIWLLLASEVPEAPDSTRQSDVIALFLGLLERPLQILLADRRATEVSIDEFEREFRELLSIIKQLEHHYSLELHDGKITIQSKILRSSLRTSQGMSSRVGLFVDYENLRPWLPTELQEKPGEVGVMLTEHAGQYGEVVCRWLCAAPRNIPSAAITTREFELVGFKVQFPRGRTGQLNPSESLTDFVLVECIVFEMMHSKPDVYIIVSGDGDYFERVSRLIEQGNSVHIVSGRNNLSARYVRLAEKYVQGQFPEGHGGLFIDYLEDMLATRN